MGSMLNLFRPVQAMLAQVKAAHQRLTASGRVEIHGEALVVFKGRRHVRDILPAEIVSVTISLNDMFSWHAFCVCVDIADTPPGRAVLIYEDFFGFEKAMSALEKLPGFDRSWRENAISGWLAETVLTAYQRDDAHVV